MSGKGCIGPEFSAQPEKCHPISRQFHMHLNSALTKYLCLRSGTKHEELGTKRTFRKLLMGFCVGGLLVSVTSCHRAKAPQTAEVVGNDRDEHGCISSAGYVWSVLKQECIRKWEVGIEMRHSQTPGLSNVAYLVTKEGSDNIEIFLPGFPKSMMLHKHHGLWTDEKHEYRLIKNDSNVYKLYNREKTLLYESLNL